MKLINVQQNSLEWLVARAGLVTASEVDALISPLWKIRDSKGVDSYLAQKLAERWIGGPLPGAMTIDMEIGKILESEAIPFFQFTFDEEIQRVGLITDDAGKMGCSPDGLIGADGGIELKCPLAQTHVKYLLAGEVPPEYAAQVQFSLYVTQRKWWKFMSYRRGFPPLVKTIEPDAKAQKAFAEAIPAFLDKLESGWKRIVEMNGGEPKRNAYREEVMQPKTDGRIDFNN